MLRACLCVVLIMLGVMTASAGQAPSFDLPVDPTVPVITLKYVGGLTELPRQNNNPLLTIRAGGSVTVSDSLGRTKDIQTSLSAEEVQELLRFTLNEQSFMDFNSGDALQAIAAQNAICGRFLRVEEGETTIIHIRTIDMDHEGSFKSLGVFAQTYPGVKLLDQLWTIERKLNGLVEELKAGGRDAVATAAEQATSFVKQQQNPVAFHVEDLQRTVMSADGRRMLEFKHDNVDGSSVTVNVEYKSDKPPAISGEISQPLKTRPLNICRTRGE